MPCFTNVRPQQLEQLKKLLEDMDNLVSSGRLELVPDSILGTIEFWMDGAEYTWEGGWADTCILAELLHHGSVETCEAVKAASARAGLEVAAHG